MRIELEGWIELSRAACALVLVSGVFAWSARSPRALRLAALGSLAGALAASAALVQLGLRQAGVPLLTPEDLALASSALLLVVAAILGVGADERATRGRVTFLVAAAMAAVLAGRAFVDGHSVVAERPPALRSPWMPVHVGAWCVAIACGAAASLAWAVARGREERLARLAERSAGAAFAAASLGLASGAMWSLEAWASLWIWDTKSALALAAWSVLGLHALATDSDERIERWRARAPVLATALMLFNLFGWGYLPGALKGWSHGIWGTARFAPNPMVAETAPTPPPGPEILLEQGPMSFPLRSR